MQFAGVASRENCSKQNLLAAQRKRCVDAEIAGGSTWLQTVMARKPGLQWLGLLLLVLPVFHGKPGVYSNKFNKTCRYAAYNISASLFQNGQEGGRYLSCSKQHMQQHTELLRSVLSWLLTPHSAVQALLSLHPWSLVWWSISTASHGKPALGLEKMWTSS